jgi:1-acyl-sn-glycerol-3-phosphate acyltransferase
LIGGFARRALRLLGWQLVYAGVPAPRGVLIVYPHTSSWDFIIGLLAKWSVDVHVIWVGKESLFRGFTGATLGRLMRRWGGRPVDRHRASGAVEQFVELLRAEDSCWLALSPEGTRRHLPHLRSGFYHLARTLGVPLGLGFIDFARKRIGVERFIMLSGDIEKDLQTLREYYADKVGLHPQLASTIAFRTQTG